LILVGPSLDLPSSHSWPLLSFSLSLSLCFSPPVATTHGQITTAQPPLTLITALPHISHPSSSSSSVGWCSSWACMRAYVRRGSLWISTLLSIKCFKCTRMQAPPFPPPPSQVPSSTLVASRWRVQNLQRYLVTSCERSSRV